MTAYKTPVLAFVFALVVALTAAAAEPAAATLGNADIVSMTRANVAPTLIINRIQSSPNNFDLSDLAFMDLKANGVADEVLSAMLAASRAGGAAASAAATAASAANNLGMQLPALPAIGGNDWSDFGADLANLPPPPALPAFSAPPGAGSAAGGAAQGSGGAAGLPALPALPSMTSMPSLDASAFSAAPAAAAPSAPAMPAAPVAMRALPAVPAVPAAPAADPFAFAPAAPAAQAFSAPPVAAAPPASPAFSSAPAAAGFDAMRFESELVTIINGAADARRAGLAWMLANQQQTLPGLRQALAAASRPEMQAGAVQVLGEMNDQSSLPVIRDLLGSPSPLVRKESARALARMNDALAIGAAEQNLGKPVDPMDGLIHLVGYARLVRASAQLGTILSGNPSAVNRAAAAAALAEIGRGGAAAWPALESALAGDADANVRREAARAVAQFHDPSSAALLMAACRRDPEVRKVALEAMADYPETVEFLVGVVGLGADQIAPDESGAARASLAKLTGQNFGADGAQWASWFAANKSAFTAGGAGGSALAAAPAAPASAPVAQGVPGLSGIPGASSGSLPPPVSVPPAQGQVDITALGMLVDSSQIPMALELERQAGAGAPAGGLLSIPGFGPGTGGAPGALSANDFGGGGAAAGAGADGLGLLGGAGSGGAAGAGAAAGGAGAAGGVGAGRLPTPAGFEEYGDDQMWGGSMPAGGGMGGGGSSAAMPAAPSMSSLPRQPVVAPAPSAPVDAGAGSSGLRLALPPMTGGDMGGGDAFGGTAAVPMPDYAAQTDFSSGDFPAQGDSSGPAVYSAQSGFGMPPADYPASAEYADPSASFDAFGGMTADGSGYADTQPYDPSAVPAGAVPYDDAEWSQYMEPGADPSAGYAAEGDSFADPYAADPYASDPSAGGDASMLFGGGGGSVDDFGGMALPPPPGSGASPDTIAFPGDTDAFGLGEPMFEDDGAGDGYAPEAGGGARLAMPPLPGSGAEDEDFGSFDDSFDGSAEAALEPRGPAILENYDYGEFDDGLSDSDADFAAGDFEAFLREADEAATAHADTLPDGTEAPAHAPEGTAEWAAGMELPPVGEPYTIKSGRATPAQSGSTVMELVRGVGLVEREAPAAPAPAVAPEPDAALPEPELIVPAPLSAPEDSSAPAAPAAARGEPGGWYYVDSSDEDAAPVDDGTPDVPIIAEDVYEVPADGDVLPADPSGRPSRTLRMRR